MTTTQSQKKQQITTILITHDHELARVLGNRLWILDNGQIIKKYTQDEKNQAHVHDFIGGIDYEKIA